MSAIFPTSSGSPSFEDEGEPVYIQRNDHVATLVLNRPAKLNAISAYMWKRLHLAISALSKEDSLRCILVKSSSAKAFSPGCDIHEFEELRSNKEQGRQYGRLMHETLAAFQNCPIPLVAEIDGICVGAGLEIASTCDFRICSEKSRFGAPIKNLGLVMAYPELEPLLQLAGKDVVLEMLLEGRIFNAAEAYEKNLVTCVVPTERLSVKVNDTISGIVTGAPLVARWHKKFVKRLITPSAVTPAEYDECFDCFDTEDFRSGCQAFLNRTPPRFRGK
ncbi:enoyl-CoA hydratase/isomerase family protein [Oxalobacter paraformigenes]|uniref:Enoyl-CoA hydratase n=1 Tax=Oxalobacter paraformigenes TaxID=556268 RepID=C3X713_9BURK|nr:enoyl-CoA hydratase/isomerase family protein [Oxalobacter paraformigenes]EEO26926.1 hypothetical protein OFAG_00079 [Oxalobacter paraformigenes]